MQHLCVPLIEHLEANGRAVFGRIDVYAKRPDAGGRHSDSHDRGPHFPDFTAEVCIGFRVVFGGMRDVAQRSCVREMIRARRDRFGPAETHVAGIVD